MTWGRMSIRSWAAWAAALSLGGALILAAEPAETPRPGEKAATAVKLSVTDAGTGRVTPCRVHLRPVSGPPVRPTGLPFWHDHFVCSGEAELALAPGRYEYTIERGPEYLAAAGEFSVEAGRPLAVTARLRRLVDLAAEGWWSGETHVHRPVDDIPLLMQAEDLHVAEVITWWNNANPWANQPLPTKPVVRFDGNRFYDVLAGEDERGGGALLFFGLKEPMAIAGSSREHPAAVAFLRQARRLPGAWIDIEKPFWWDAPVWLAAGADSVGLAQNHMHRGGVLDNEAWGRPRDRDRYPGPHGNGRWTQDIYYHALNCGLRVPPTAGSASGVLANPVGYNRVYVHLGGEITYERWWQGVAEGRVFVTNGPLLRVRADGHLPGHVFRGDGPLSLAIEGRLDSRDPVGALELVRNGRAEPLRLPSRITVDESGWFLVRAVADVPHTFRFASTGPFYVEIGARPRPVRRESARFFLDWVRERIARLQLDDPRQRAEVLATLHEAERFWQAKADEGR